MNEFWNNLSFEGLDCWTIKSYSEEITMLKSVVMASAICLVLVVPAAAQSAKFACDETGLANLRTQIDAMTDKEKQKASLAAWEAANTAFKANDIKTCNDRIGDSDKGVNSTEGT